MSTMRAWACGERSTAAWRVSGPTATSSAYRPRPRRNRWSSTRWTPWPISLVVTTPSASQPGGGVVVVALLVGELAGLRRGRLRRGVADPGAARELGRPLHGPDDVLVAGAAAQVAGDHVDRLLVRRRGVVAQPGGDGGE